MEVKIIKKQRIVQIEAMVESESAKGTWYLVEFKDEEWTCSCPLYKYTKKDLMQGKKQCKHIAEVQGEVGVYE